MRSHSWRNDLSIGRIIRIAHRVDHPGLFHPYKQCSAEELRIYGARLRLGLDRPAERVAQIGMLYPHFAEPAPWCVEPRARRFGRRSIRVLPSLPCIWIGIDRWARGDQRQDRWWVPLC
jgi:hypothetical protein